MSVWRIRAVWRSGELAIECSRVGYVSLNVCQPILPIPAFVAAGLIYSDSIISGHRGLPEAPANTKSRLLTYSDRALCARSISARSGSRGRSVADASVLVG